MNPLKMSKEMGKLAGDICQGMDADAAAILLFKDGKLACYFGSPDTFSKENMTHLMEMIGKHFTQMAPDIANEKIKPIKIDDDNTVLLTPNKIELPPSQYRSN